LHHVTHIFQQIESPGMARKPFAELDRTYTYGTLTDTIDRLGGLFRHLAVTPGQRIVISSQNAFVVSSLVLAGLKYGITTMLIDPETGPTRADQLIQTGAPDAFLVDQSLIARWNLSARSGRVFSWLPRAQKKGALFQKMLGKKKPVTGPKAFAEAIADFPRQDAPDGLDPETIGFILFTSGSTGAAKAVQISHRAILANLRSVASVYRLTPDSRIYNILPLYHTDGLFQGPLLTAFAGATWYHPLAFSLDQIPHIFDGMYKYQISHFITVPTMLSLLHQLAEGYEDSFKGDDFQYISASAAPLEVPLWEAFEDTFGCQLLNLYGLTETVCIATACGPDPETRKIGTVGKTVDCDCRIVDEHDREVPPGQVGELLIRGDLLFSGYLHNPDATRAVLQDGWFRTGDLARQDEEGFLTITGRKKNLVISGGINIQPEEVAGILENHPAVREAACLGQPDPVFGEKLVAAVVLHANTNTSTADLVVHCRQELESAKIPREIRFLDQLPRTGSGKIAGPALRELLEAEQQEGDHQKSDLMAGLIAAAAEAFSVRPSTLDLSHSAENLDGWDSMAHLIFVTNLEKQFGVRFNAREVMIMSNMRTAFDLLRQKVN